MIGFLNAHSQEYLFDLEAITMENGLPARMVYDIVQDKDGFIWISSQFGIHRYDGDRFKTITTQELGLPSRSPAIMAIDDHNRLWYTSADGAALPIYAGVLDLRTDSILSISQATNGVLQSTEVVKIAKPYQDEGGEGPLDQDERGIVLLGADGTVYHYVDNCKVIGKIKVDNLRNILLLSGPDGELWMRKEMVYYRLQKNGQLDSLEFPFDAEGFHLTESIIGGKFTFSFKGKDTFGTYQFSEGKFTQMELPGGGQRVLEQVIYQGSDYSIYASEDSVFVFSPKGQLLDGFKAFEDHVQGTMVQIKSNLRDQQSNHWMVSSEGVHKVSVQRNPFSVLYQGKNVYGLLIENGRFWKGGINLPLCEVRGVPKPVAFPPSDYVKSLFKDSQGQIWMLGHHNLIIRYVLEEDSVHVLSVGKEHRLTRMFENLETGNFLVGSRIGLLRLEHTGDKVETPYILVSSNGKTTTIRDFHQNDEGIWVVHSLGLDLLNPKTERSVRRVNAASGLPFEDLNDLYEDTEGNFWLASRGGGLILWNRSDNTFQQFTVEKGLSNNNIYAVYEDDYGNLILPSDYGLMLFDKQSHEIRVFHKENGIAHEEFNTNSHFQDEDGTMYLGGLGGLTKFHPKDLQTEPTFAEPPIYLTKVRVLEKGATIYADRTNHLRAEKQIILSPGDQVLDLELSYLDFKDTEKNQLAYRLLGFQEDWVYPREQSINLMNLPYGNYELEVRARGAAGKWTQSILRIPIAVLKPFYLKTWFIIAMAVLLIALIFAGVQLRTRALKRDRLRLASEVRKRTATIAAQAEDLKELDRMKTRFFANITHEIRTPLTLVIGPTEQLLEAEQPKETRKGLQSILKNSRHLLGLLNQLLDISKLENKQMKLAMAHGDLVAYTGELIEQFQGMAHQQQLTLQFHSKQEDLETNFDPDKWNKIIFNLVSNAIKFTPAGGTVDVHLQVAEEHTSSKVEKEKRSHGLTNEHTSPQMILEVRDSGKGIPPEELERVFDRFYQVEGGSTRTEGGTGIGLALVKELVELQGGRIEVESEVGQGTVFRVSIPLQKQLEDPDQPEAEPATGTGLETRPDPELRTSEEAVPNSEKRPATSPQAKRLELLLVEDNAELRSYIRSCIDENLYHITEAANGEEGLNSAKELVPDLIISDVMMPKMDGFALTEAIRQHLATSHIPLILLTAKASLENRLEGLRRGADAYLTKPFSPLELRLRIGKLIELRQMMQARYRTANTVEEVGKPKLASAPQFEQEDHFISDLKSFICENLDDPDLKVPMIATHFGVSKTQLYRKLSSLTDQGVADIVRSERCERALELIREQELSLSEIAYEVGFSSPSHFSRSFKQQFGVTPSDTLQKLRGKQVNI